MSIARGTASFLAFALLLGPGCAGPERRAPPRVVIIGIDGFDWNLVDPLVERGTMPVLADLLRRGTRADLLTLVPLEKSPVIWTTIATGRLPAEKGRGFLVPAQGEDGAARQVYTAWHRTTRAFWNIVSEAGLSVSVLGWLETWPAEEVNGTIVTDYVKYFVAQGAEGAGTTGRTHPAQLEQEIEPLVVRADSIADESLRVLLGEGIGAEPPRGAREGMDALRWIWAGDLTFAAVAREFLRNRPEDVMAVYLRGPDAVCHQFWGDRERVAQGDTTASTRLFGQTVDRYLEETDRLLGGILREIDLRRTSVLLVSDHGFQGPRVGIDQSARQGIYMHRELGTVLLAGPWAAAEGAVVTGARVQDILPTLLHALDLPVGEDLDGEVAIALLGPEGGRDRAPRTVPTWETTPLPRAGEAPESPVAREIREQVEALGYVE
ncbi:MAG: alkaline phosphatase family protein [Candidatus Eiseniibacteriota bacterium]